MKSLILYHGIKISTFNHILNFYTIKLFTLINWFTTQISYNDPKTNNTESRIIFHQTAWYNSTVNGTEECTVNY